MRTAKHEPSAALGQRESETVADPTLLGTHYPRLYRFALCGTDPVAGSILNPQSLNRYAYVLNNPVNLIDPLGLQDHRRDPEERLEDIMERLGRLEVHNPHAPMLTFGMSLLDLKLAGLVYIGPAAGYCPPQFVSCGQYLGGTVGFDQSGQAWEVVFGQPGGGLGEPIGGLEVADEPLFWGTVWDLVKEGKYHNPFDNPPFNTHHPGEFSMREVFGTVCSEHATVSLGEGTVANRHRDTLNPVPLWPLLIGPPGLTAATWVLTIPAHYILDVRKGGAYPSRKACY